jgi:hypothetical protein
VFVAAVLALFAPTSALAAPRTWYVAANGVETGSCEQLQPCNLQHLVGAFSGAIASGDTVVLAGNTGTYGTQGTPLALTIIVPEGVTFTGAPGQPMPRIFTNAAASEPAVKLEGPRATLSGLDIEYTGGAGFSAVFGEGRLERVIARSTGPGNGCILTAGQISNSVCAGESGISDSAAAAGPLTDELVIRNSTIYGSTGYGLVLVANQELGFLVKATNSIFHSAGGAGKDIYADALTSKDTVEVELEHSDYSSVAKEGPGTTKVTTAGTNSNLTTSPLFVNATTGDFREAPGSPTIDAGVNSPLNGSLDLAGNPREIAGHTDIGAYEFLIPPTVVTGAASRVGQSTATLAGTVNPNGIATSYHFVYGTTTGYGSATPATSEGSGTSASAVSAPLAGLAPNTTYHYALVASNSAGEASGSDGSFTTPPASSPPPPSARIASLAGLSETNRVFAPEGTSTPLTGVTSKRHAHPHAKRGTTFSFSLDQSATIIAQIQRTGSGRRARHTCVGNSKRLRRKPRCTIYTTVATLTRSAHAGLNKLPFSGRIGGKALTPGRYRALFTATNAAGTSKEQAISFTIVR